MSQERPLRCAAALSLAPVSDVGGHQPAAIVPLGDIIKTEDPIQQLRCLQLQRLQRLRVVHLGAAPSSALHARTRGAHAPKVVLHERTELDSRALAEALRYDGPDELIGAMRGHNSGQVLLLLGSSFSAPMADYGGSGDREQSSSSFGFMSGRSDRAKQAEAVASVINSFPTISREHPPTLEDQRILAGISTDMLSRAALGGAMGLIVSEAGAPRGLAHGGGLAADPCPHSGQAGSCPGSPRRR